MGVGMSPVGVNIDALLPVGGASDETIPFSPSLWSDVMLRHRARFLNADYNMPQMLPKRANRDGRARTLDRYAVRRLHPDCSCESLRVWRGLYIDRYHETKSVIMRLREEAKKEQLEGGVECH